MKSDITNKNDKYKECACKGCSRDGTNHLRIAFLCKEGWFCDSCATDLRFHGLAEYADTRSDIE